MDMIEKIWRKNIAQDYYTMMGCLRVLSLNVLLRSAISVMSPAMLDSKTIA